VIVLVADVRSSSHAEFADEEGILFDLLVDPHRTVAEAFGLDIDKSHTDRQPFVLTGRKVFVTYNPELADSSEHARDVLNDIRNEFITAGQIH